MECSLKIGYRQRGKKKGVWDIILVGGWVLGGGRNGMEKKRRFDETERCGGG